MRKPHLRRPAGDARPPRSDPPAAAPIPTKARRQPRPARSADEQARRLRFWARLVLIPVALIGAALSFRGLYAGAKPTFGTYLALGFPALVDLLILGSCLAYVAGAKVGRAMPGWKRTAYLGVAGTLLLNALAATHWADVPWHITAPAVWAALVELTAAQVLGEYEATQTYETNRIRLTLWITAPRESLKTRLLMAHTGIRDAIAARAALGVHAAASQALLLALPGTEAKEARRFINQLIRRGALDPAAILAPIGWSQTAATGRVHSPETILREILTRVLAPTRTPTPIPPPAPALIEAERPTQSERPAFGTGPLPNPEPITDARVRAVSASESGTIHESRDETAAPQPLDAIMAPDNVSVEPPDTGSTDLRPRDNQEDHRSQDQHRPPAHGEPSPQHQEQAEMDAGDEPERTVAGARELSSDHDEAPGEHESQDVETDDETIDAVDETGDRLQQTDMKRRLNDAVDLVINDPNISGPEMRDELRAKGWDMSVRTARRILREARREAATAHRPTLTAVRN